MTNANIAFIGAGNMTRAIVDGLLNHNYPKDKLYIANRSAEKLAYFPVNTSTDNLAMATQADVIVLAVKPSQVVAICQQLHALCQQRQLLIISLAVGITIETMLKHLPEKTAIVRSMPNTPAAIGVGASGLFANQYVTSQQQQIASDIFTAVGKIAWVESEPLLDVVAAVSGSGPAYYFLMMQAMLAGAEKLGLNTELAGSLISQTVIGAGKLAEANNNQFALLREQVTSPKGTTFAALQHFQQHDFSQIVEQAMQTALNRSKEIANQH